MASGFKAMIKLQEDKGKRPVREQLNTCIERYNDHVVKGLKLGALERKMIYVMLQLPDKFVAVLRSHYQKYRHDQGGRACIVPHSLANAFVPAYVFVCLVPQNIIIACQPSPWKPWRRTSSFRAMSRRGSVMGGVRS